MKASVILAAQGVAMAARQRQKCGIDHIVAVSRSGMRYRYFDHAE